MDMRDLPRGTRVALDDGPHQPIVTVEVKLREGYRVRWSDGGSDDIRFQDIVRVVQDRPADFWDALVSRMTSPDHHEGPKAFMAAVKVTRKIKHLPTWGSINAIPFLYRRLHNRFRSCLSSGHAW
jgi:hypothetical protein